MNKEEFVKIGYDQIPKETFDKYNAKPFEIAVKKARGEKGETISSISFIDAKKEAEKRGCRLITINEFLVLLDAYREKYPDNADFNHDEFLGIDELAYKHDVCYEFVDSLTDVPFLRGGGWYNGSNAGAFALSLSWSGTTSYSAVGFRCAR